MHGVVDIMYVILFTLLRRYIFAEMLSNFEMNRIRYFMNSYIQYTVNTAL